MSPLRLTGSTSGYSQIDAPAVAGDQTFTLPGTGGTLATTNAGSVTTAMLADSVPVAKAWVNFNGTGTVAIRGSYNVSSITDNTTGNYTVHFTNALTDVNYVVCASQYGYDYPSSTVANNVGFASLATTSVRIVTTSFTNSGTDFDQVHVAVFR